MPDARAELVLTIDLEEPELLQDTAEEFAVELERAINTCYACEGEEICSKHQAQASEMKENLRALAMGMIRVTIE